MRDHFGDYTCDFILESIIMSVRVIIRKQEQIIENTANLTVKKVFKRLDLLPETYLVVRDGDLITENDILKDGDVIQLVPVISGG